VSDLVRDAVSAHAAAMERAGVTVELELDPDTPPLPLDRDAISAAVVNLLDNAAKFGAGAPVVVRTDNVAGEAVIEVADRGPGVPDAEKERVFERFFRGAADAVQETRGTGIGLALVRHAAEAHGGHAEVVETPGGGATFRIVLPVRSADEVEGS
jgi:signal transduction histidine kinase